MLRFTRHRASLLQAGVAPIGLVLASLANPAFAQDANTAQSTQDAQDTAGEPTADIVVTGSILRRTDEATVSPVTTISVENLDQRGISTIQEGLQEITANNGPALTNSFSANGAFAGGASAVSLRGLTTNSTLVLFDGMRGAYYPLADDGTRNFVDLNTIPDDIVERVEVLRDGASSSYGADAIAGVVNIITKREVKGLSGRAEGGISTRGDASEYRLSLTGGIGDLEEQGFNAYLSGFYYRSAELENSQRPYPYNTDDQRGICYQDHCGPNNIINGVDENGAIPADVAFGMSPFLVRPYDPATATPIAGTRYQQLETNLCRGLPSYGLSDAELAANPEQPTTLCQEDMTNLYGTIQPKIERFGFSGRVTAKFGDTGEAYAEFNFLQSNSSYDGAPQRVSANANAGIDYKPFSTVSGGAARAPGSGAIYLPVYVCPRDTVGDCTAANGTLNPNNPYAAQGQAAQLFGRLPGQTFNMTRSRAYRGALGVQGSINDNMQYNVKATAMHIDLQRKATGYIYIQHLLDVVKDGSYNFMDPSANSQDVIDYLTPDNINTSTSDLYQLEGNVQTALFDLPGGPMQLGVGGSIRYEAVDAPSFNPDYNGPTERYFTFNAFGTKGHRTVYSAFAELAAPILPQVELDLSGRYDNYSSGQDAFSPKVGLKVQPIEQVVLRGTWSKGFRVPSFGEANALPTTGYVTNSASSFPDAYLAQYGCSQDTFDSCPTYIRQSSVGLTTLASPDLKPEKSRSFTGGILVEPMRNVSFSVDYYNIKKTDVITSAPSAPALLAYYTGQAIPEGYTVTPGSPDPNNPDLLPVAGFVESHFINANTVKSEGIDFAVNASFDISDAFRWTIAGDANYIINLSTEFPDGSVQSYEGTLGNFNLTAGSGTPEWRGVLSSTFDFGDVALTATGNYFDGYNLSAADQGNEPGDCGLSPGYVPCNVDSYVTLDLVGDFKINDKVDFYVSMLNVFDDLPPLDPVTYGAYLYNPIQGGQGILGRYVKAGVKFGF
ncbi:MAG TPA: TonB-dependent receptor [Sphingomonas sp.]|nr:TonB-dependent receptor [Sphingomonas sp.]